MNRRSRGGCIDCRKAKVKCDEIKPHCGTCKRRRHECQGYNNVTSAGNPAPPPRRSTSITASSPVSSSSSSSSSISSSNVVTSRGRRHRRHSSTLKSISSPSIISVTVTAAATEEEEDLVEEDHPNDSGEDDDDSKITTTQAYTRYQRRQSRADLTTQDDGLVGYTAIHKRPFSRFHEPVTTTYPTTCVPKAGHPLIMDPTLLTPRALGLIPPGVVSSTDRPTVELYFTRHPYELNISAEFVHEMNANVLAILQQSPHAIVDSLSAIGHSYLAAAGRAASSSSSSSASSSSLAVLNYRARILATLRGAMPLDRAAADYNLEVMVFMLLGLSATELVDGQTWAAPVETTIPAVIANAASLLAHHVSMGRPISPLARYFIRALARQDMIVSLVRLHRPMIPTWLWLDETARTSADRLMGYTTTLMPLLEELCGLAEDVKNLLSLQQQQQHEEKANEDDGEAFSQEQDHYKRTACGDLNSAGTLHAQQQQQQQQQQKEDETGLRSPISQSNDSPSSLGPSRDTSQAIAPSTTITSTTFGHNQYSARDFDVLASSKTTHRSSLSPTLPTSSVSIRPQPPPSSTNIPPSYAQRAESLRQRIDSWKPNITHGLSFRNSRRYLAQAACYRSGALLYLFRLLHPPSPSPTSYYHPHHPTDGEATALAHEILLSCGSSGSRGRGPSSSSSNDDEEVKMLLWPVFLAACEMSAEDDRQMVLDVLDAIMRQRRTVTAARTKGFVLRRVWPARDEGREWNWVVLAEQFPGECLPI